MGRIFIPFSKNFLFLLANKIFQVNFYIPPSELRICLFNEIWRDQSRWKAEDVRLRKYGRDSKTSQPGPNKLYSGYKEECSLALSWWQAMCLWSTCSGRFWWVVVFNLPAVQNWWSCQGKEAYKRQDQSPANWKHNLRGVKPCFQSGLKWFAALSHDLLCFTFSIILF